MEGKDNVTVLKDEQYQRLLRRRAKYAWSFAVVSFLCLVIFIALATMTPDLYAHQLFSVGFLTVGMAAGICLFIVCISLTGVYLHRCNVEFDPLQKELLEQRNENS
jgi:uncharacterized membrane protein (DUF485 family)